MFGTSRRVARRTARRTSRRQMAMYGDQGGGGGEEYYEEPAPAAPAAPAAPDPMEQLEKLAQLHTQGILTDEEFAAQKAKLLGLDASNAEGRRARRRAPAVRAVRTMECR